MIGEMNFESQMPGMGVDKDPIRDVRVVRGRFASSLGLCALGVLRG
jgi:hypothetical protein